jgi:hypothetical protein
MTTSYPIDQTKLTGIVLKKGGHSSPEQGLCLMEALAYVRGIDHTDHPACVAPVLGEMGRSLNDVLPDTLRQDLVPLIPVLPGTAGDGHDEKRSYMALDWLIRVYLPTWLELSPACREDAAKVRELGRIVDVASAQRARPVVEQAQRTADAAGAAAGAAAGDAARAAWAAARAAWAAAGDAARAAWAAAWAAAGDAAGDAAWDAAWAAAGDAAGDADWAAAGDAARAAARAAAGAAAGDAARAAWAAAGDALAPTVEQLQRSAIDLYGRMARLGQGGAA